MASSSPAQLLGDRRAAEAEALEFRAIVDRLASRMLRLAARVVGDQAQAEDVLQEAWASAYQARRAQRFEGRASVDTWLYRIVLRAALNARRSQGRRHQLTANAPPSASDPAAKLEARSSLREIAALLDALPEEQAAALLLKEVEGLSAAEVARTLECSEGAIEQRLVRARAALRERFPHD